MNTLTDMRIWQRALNMAVSLYQVDASRGRVVHDDSTAEEFGHMFSASLDSVYKDYMFLDMSELTDEQIQNLFLDPEN